MRFLLGQYCRGFRLDVHWLFQLANLVLCQLQYVTPICEVFINVKEHVQFFLQSTCN